ncbi:MAG: hypothetical protein IT254_06125 [Chitinophagaceae bacterium]|nr:hypothetical protein [Bacteroidota bacterium]MCC6257878.1 hypothetical protein [Chitinophagaceae bacterium]MCW5916193.1 hypothetical protein [Ferruginibacter sp.]
MPKQSGTELIGTFDGMIYYKSGNEYLVRAKGKTGKQADVAKQQAGILGKASGLSARIRAALKPIVFVSNTRSFMYRFNNVIQKWLRTEAYKQEGWIRNIEGIQGFSLKADDYSSFGVVMDVTRNENGQLILQIPTFDSPNPIHPLPFNGKISFDFVAVAVTLNEPVVTERYHTRVDINYNGQYEPGRQILLPIQSGAGKLVVIGLSINDGADAGIIATMYN